MNKKILSFSALAMIAASAVAQGEYTVSGKAEKEDFSGKIYLVNVLDNREIVDSTEVTAGKFTFKGKVDEPKLVFTFEREAGIHSAFILEPGNISLVNGREAAGSGTPLNEDMKAIYESQKAIMDAAETVEEANAKLQPMLDELLQKHNNDILTLYALLSVENYLSPAYNLSYVERAGQEVKNNPVIVSKMDAWKAEAKTAPGMMFTDFTVEYEGKKTSLSDYVGKGKYVLVDFWASWCGPCRREIPHIAELYAKYKDKNFEVLGVATWDAPEATKKAMAELNVTWPQILNAQKIGSDAYGVTGIPQIILFAPDGKIIARNLYGDVLKKAVDDAMAK